MTLHLTTGCASSDPLPVPDAGDEDAGVVTPDVSVIPDVREEPDVIEEEDTGPPLICAAGFADCDDDGNVVRCSEDRTQYLTEACSGGKECRAGECLDPIICQQGERSCVSATQYEECRPGGTAFRVVACENDDSCIDGVCVSGERNGGECAADGDCAGGLCHCGTGTDDACAAKWTRAYCSAECATSTDCAGDEICVAGDVHQLESAAANVNHCVKGCQGSCAIDGLSCKWLPTYDGAGALTFEQGCYFDAAAEVGGECQTDTDCVGGVCLKDYFNTNYCTSPCGAQGCPDNAACVQLGGSEYYCSLLCGDGSVGGTDRCPLEPTVADERIDVSCKLATTIEGPAKRVCVNPSKQ